MDKLSRAYCCKIKKRFFPNIVCNQQTRAASGAIRSQCESIGILNYNKLFCLKFSILILLPGHGENYREIFERIKMLHVFLPYS